MRKLSGSMAALIVLVGTTPNTLAAQDDSWQRKWYWGVQSGITTYGSVGGTTLTAFTAGGHWLITGRRSALYIGLDAVRFGPGSGGGGVNVPMANPQSPTGFTNVTFRNGSRFQMILYAIPTDAKLQIYAGGGFLINQITGADPTNASALSSAELSSALRLIDARDTKAYALFSGGLQWRLGRWGLYGEYKFLPSSEDFLLTNAQHTIVGGLRFALTHANESISTDR